MGWCDPSSDPFGATFSPKREKEFVTHRHFALDSVALMFYVCSDATLKPLSHP